MIGRPHRRIEWGVGFFELVVQGHVGHTEIRVVVHLDVLVGDDGARVGAQAEGQRQDNAPTVLLSMLTTDHTTVLDQQIKAQRGAVVDNLVDIERGTTAQLEIVLIETEADATGDEALQRRRLGHLIDVTTNATAAVVGNQTLEHLDLLDVEHIANIATVITHAIDENATADVETAQTEVVNATGETVFANLEANAGDVLQHINQNAGILLAEQNFRNDIDRLQHIEQNSSLFRRGHLVDLVS